jgi:hypothetical protein
MNVNDPARPSHGAPTEPEIRDLATRWYRLLDEHAPVSAVLPLLTADGLEFQLPEGTLKGPEEFTRWYEGVIRAFFDEAHELKKVEVRPGPESTEVDVIVNWQAKRWHPPAAASEWIGFDSYQRWVVARSPHDQRPVIVTYVVDALEPMAGSPQL